MSTNTNASSGLSAEAFQKLKNLSLKRESSGSYTAQNGQYYGRYH